MDNGGIGRRSRHWDGWLLSMKASQRCLFDKYLWPIWASPHSPLLVRMSEPSADWTAMMALARLLKSATASSSCERGEPPLPALVIGWLSVGRLLDTDPGVGELPVEEGLFAFRN